MRTSDTTGALGEALAKAQGEIEAASKDAKNPHLRNKYADLASVWDACRKPLAANGLGITQGISTELKDGQWLLHCTTRMVHASSEWIEEILTLPVMTQKGITLAQSIGIAATYSRRYGMSAMVGIAQEGTDGGAPKGAQSREDREAEDIITRASAAKAARTLAIKRLLSRDKTEGFSGAAFSRALKAKEIEHSYEMVKHWCVWLGKSKPSQMDDEGATKVINFLASDKGKESWAAFEAACGPLPVPKAKKAPTLSETLHDVSLTLDDVRGYCESREWPAPETLDDEGRAKLIGWLTTKKDGATGADAVVAWLESRQGGEA